MLVVICVAHAISDSFYAWLVLLGEQYKPLNRKMQEKKINMSDQWFWIDIVCLDQQHTLEMETINRSNGFPLKMETIKRSNQIYEQAIQPDHTSEVVRRLRVNDDGFVELSLIQNSPPLGGGWGEVRRQDRPWPSTPPSCG
jgi:hypothetical protein